MSSNIVARSVNLTRNLAAAVLLMRVAYWMPRTVITRDGERWVAKTSKEWCDDTGLSPKQYKTAIAHLKSIGMVVVEQHFFGGKNVTHVRVPSAQYGQLRMAHMGPTEEAQTGQPNIHSDNTLSLDTQKVPSPEDGLGEGTCNLETNGHTKTDPGEDMKFDKPFKVADVANGSVLPKTKRKPKALDLSYEWSELVPEHFGVQANLNVKQTAMFSQVAKRFGDRSLDAVRLLVKEWAEFCARVKVDDGIKTPPAVPNIQFLTAHMACAINFTSERWAAKPKSKIKLKIVSKPQKPDYEKASLEDLLGIAGDDE